MVMDGFRRLYRVVEGCKRLLRPEGGRLATAFKPRLRLRQGLPLVLGTVPLVGGRLTGCENDTSAADHHPNSQKRPHVFSAMSTPLGKVVRQGWRRL